MSSIENSLKKIIINDIILLVINDFCEEIIMNRKGFTLIELLATFVVLGVIISITVIGISDIFGAAKNKTEEVFVGTIRDAMDMYLTSSQAKRLNFLYECGNKIGKSYGERTVRYAGYINFENVFSSEYHPITSDEFENPANEEKCEPTSGIRIYRDDDYVYYYKIEGDLGCLSKNMVISNLPEGFVC